MARRKVFDCRNFPGPCSLVVAGTEEEAWAAQIAHTVAAHAQEDGPELRALLEQHVHDEDEWLAAQIAAVGEETR
ncbi:MAG TPA: DUF1059 domain-containing protein [Acidimicrobiia bacterium]|nr:DUF1059 domain-containing protein [Acidimicrobiia bacterium]